MVGIVLVSGGIISLAFQGRRLPETGIFYALGTGLFIAAYSVTDGIGGRLSGSAVSYTLWMCLIWGATALPLYWLRRPGDAIWQGARATGLAALGGVVSVLAYGIVIFAMTRRADGFGVGLAGNQRVVRGAAGADIFRRNADGAPDSIGAGDRGGSAMPGMRQA